MKKVYDWDVGLSIYIENNNKTIKIVCSIHTLIHQLKLEICKKLNLMIFDTEIEIYGNSWRPLKPTSTLQQNGIEGKFGTLRAVVKREKANHALDVRVEENYDKRTTKKSEIEEKGLGLSLIASCTNPACINYQQDTEVHYGYGTVDFYSLISGLKCEVCPYRSQFLRPTMMCKGAKLSYCTYKLEGTKTDDQGIPTQMTSKFSTVKSNKDILKTIQSSSWDRNIRLIIKHL